MGGDHREPLDDAYGRVTNPERYRALHEAARSCIDDLSRRFAVNRVDGTELDPYAARAWPGASATTLVPDGGGAPITFTFTPFPGIIIAFGHSGHGGFPTCGCDVCDEDPAEEVQRMTELVADIVGGGLVERREHRILRRDTYEQRWERVSGEILRRRGPVDDDSDSPVPIGTTDWPAWSAP